MVTSPMIIDEKYILRPAEEGDIPGIVSCIREEYGDCYYRRAFYSEDYLRKNMPHLNLFVAVEGEQLCGFQSMISHKPEDEYVEGDLACRESWWIIPTISQENKAFTAYTQRLLPFTRLPSLCVRRRECYQSALTLEVISHPKCITAFIWEAMRNMSRPFFYYR